LNGLHAKATAWAGNQNPHLPPNWGRPFWATRFWAISSTKNTVMGGPVSGLTVEAMRRAQGGPGKKKSGNITFIF
jgi:hypothetical protein